MDKVDFSYADQALSPVRRNVIRLIEAATGQRELKRLYLDNHRHPVASESFWQAAVRQLRIDVRFDDAALARLPRQGPLVVVANHPYGVLDGIVISWLVEKVRPDFRVLTNAVLLRAPEVRDHLLPIDFAGTEEALATNLRSRAAARDHLAAGGCVVVFPAGGVSTAPDRLGRKRAVDAPWQPFVAQLIQRSRATVAPVRFSGQNSRLFQIASHISPTLRLSLIFREVRNRIGTVLPVAIGAPVPFADLQHLDDRRAMVDALRLQTEALAEPPAAGASGPDGKLRAMARKARARLDRLRRIRVGVQTRPLLHRPAWTRRRAAADQPRPR